jgi:hypothetical protein
MSGAIPPFPQYASMAWCSVKSTGLTLPLKHPVAYVPDTRSVAPDDGNHHFTTKAKKTLNHQIRAVKYRGREGFLHH